jgi:hypothetical protein
LEVLADCSAVSSSASKQIGCFPDDFDQSREGEVEQPVRIQVGALLASLDFNCFTRMI